jgi:hypothetical protein
MVYRVVIKMRQKAKMPVSNALWDASKLRKHSLLCMIKTEMTASSSKQTFCKKMLMTTLGLRVKFIPSPHPY